MSSVPATTSFLETDAHSLNKLKGVNLDYWRHNLQHIPFIYSISQHFSYHLNHYLFYLLNYKTNGVRQSQNHLAGENSASSKDSLAEISSQPTMSQQHHKFGGGSRQNQSKRQKEWIYLCHYIAISGLNPLHIISGQDDGQEPDFTLIFYQQPRLYYVGVELTTLPRLRDQMGEESLIGKRWYWQGLHVMANQRQKMIGYQRFKLPIQTFYMPSDEFNRRWGKLPHSIISQEDIDAVMQKKAHKVLGYHTRRPLDELWLLVHTDKYQPDSILTSAKKPLVLYHTSGFNQVQVTRYPSHKIINVAKLNQQKSN
ncbi:MAG: hypothetical protein Q4P13_03035 [Psychrobacter sp.]|nr:hypothetical protein [Psychrobacter sp.]